MTRTSRDTRHTGRRQIIDNRVECPCVHPLDTPKDGMQYLVPGQVGIEHGLALFYLADDHIDRLGFETKCRIIDQEHPAVLVCVGVGREQVAGKSNRHHIDVGERLV